MPKNQTVIVLGSASDADKIQTAGMASIVTMEGALQVRYRGQMYSVLADLEFQYFEKGEDN